MSRVYNFSAGPAVLPEEVLGSARTRIRQLDDELDKLVGVRTRAINRKLGAIEKLSPEKNALAENNKNHQL